jgi:chromatin assembly factor 1 subunit A
MDETESEPVQTTETPQIVDKEFEKQVKKMKKETEKTAKELEKLRKEAEKEAEKVRKETEKREKESAKLAAEQAKLEKQKLLEEEKRIKEQKKEEERLAKEQKKEEEKLAKKNQPSNAGRKKKTEVTRTEDVDSDEDNDDQPTIANQYGPEDVFIKFDGYTDIFHKENDQSTYVYRKWIDPKTNGEVIDKVGYHRTVNQQLKIIFFTQYNFLATQSKETM